MNILPREKQIAAISALCEGVSIRATERLTGVNRGTIMNLGVTDHVWSIGELIDAALDGELPSGSGPEFPKNLDPSDTIQSLPNVKKFSVIDGGKGTAL